MTTHPMVTNGPDVVRYFRTREGAVKGAYRMHAVGNAATIVGPYDGRFAAVNLDAPVANVKVALEDLGYGSAAAKAEAWRLIKRGY